MRYHLLAFALVAVAWVASAAPVQAQYYPYGYGYPPQLVVRPNPGIQNLGRLPNGTQVINPWNMYNNQNYSGMNVLAVNPYYGGYYGGYYGDGSGYYPYANFQNNFPIVQRQPGRFIPVAADLAINPITGTQLAPYRGIAQTNQGTFFRIPGTGSLTAFGTFDPTSGAYLNPITGAVFNPGSGLIIQP